MSLNYYLQRKSAPQRWGCALSYVEFFEQDGEYALHLCHTAIGWKTLFQATPLFDTFDALIHECGLSMAEGATIKDEYGKVYSLAEFKKCVCAYKDLEQRKVIIDGIELTQPIAHDEYLAKGAMSKAIEGTYYVVDGYDFCRANFS